MSFQKHRTLAIATALALATAGTIMVARASDHQDTPEVELNPRCDVNDVYAFPGSSADRICLVMTTSSPLSPGASAGATFDSDKLYQIKVDNDSPRDGVEDYVLQFLFSGSGSSQTVSLVGPVAPVQTGTMNKISPATAAVTGGINTVLGSSANIQLFCGVRDDPFWIDLEQFFRIIPDRKPSTGLLSALPDTATASSFRDPGDAVDFLEGLNCLAIVVELPTSMLTAGGTSTLGVWGTISQ